MLYLYCLLQIQSRGKSNTTSIASALEANCTGCERSGRLLFQPHKSDACQAHQDNLRYGDRILPKRVKRLKRVARGASFGLAWQHHTLFLRCRPSRRLVMKVMTRNALSPLGSTRDIGESTMHNSGTWHL